MEAEQPLTLKSLQAHVIKTFIGSLVAAILVVIGALLVFYFNTTGKLEEHDNKLNKVIITVDKHSEMISNNSNDYNISETELKNFDKRMTAIEETQQEMMKLLIELLSTQKAMVKNIGN